MLARLHALLLDMFGPSISEGALVTMPVGGRQTAPGRGLADQGAPARFPRPDLRRDRGAVGLDELVVMGVPPRDGSGVRR